MAVVLGVGTDLKYIGVAADTNPVGKGGRPTKPPAVGGPAQKMTFFQVVQKSFLSVPIYCTRCKYDSLDFFFKNIAWNLSVECVKHENVGYGRFNSRVFTRFLGSMSLLDTEYGTNNDTLVCCGWAYGSTLRLI